MARPDDEDDEKPKRPRSPRGGPPRRKSGRAQPGRERGGRREDDPLPDARATAAHRPGAPVEAHPAVARPPDGPGETPARVDATRPVAAINRSGRAVAAARAVPGRPVPRIVTAARAGHRMRRRALEVIRAARAAHPGSPKPSRSGGTRGGRRADRGTGRDRDGRTGKPRAKPGARARRGAAAGSARGPRSPTQRAPSASGVLTSRLARAWSGAVATGGRSQRGRRRAQATPFAGQAHPTSERTASSPSRL